MLGILWRPIKEIYQTIYWFSKDILDAWCIWNTLNITNFTQNVCIESGHNANFVTTGENA